MLVDLGSELEQLNDIPTLWDRSLAALLSQGIEFVIYVTVDKNRRNPFVLTNTPEVYKGIDPAADPFLEHCCNSYNITNTGPAFIDEYDWLPDADRAFIKNAAEVTGWQTGIGIPMRLSGSDRYGGFNMGTRGPLDAFARDIEPRAEEFRFFCLLVHRRIEELSRLQMNQVNTNFRDLLVAPEQDALAGLSPREKEVIYLISRGVSRKECARLCGISQNTIGEYIQSAYRKLGVQNRVEAARLVLASV